MLNEMQIARSRAEGLTTVEGLPRWLRWPLAKVKSTDPEPFNKEKLIKALALNSPELVQELHEGMQRRIDVQTARQGRLDAKATSLLTAAALASTVAFGFGAGLLKGDVELPFWAKVAFGAAILFGFGAALLAVLALGVRAYQDVSDEAMFNEAKLREFNDIAEDDGKPTRKYGVMEYRKYMIIQSWEILQKQMANHEAKAFLVRVGQIALGLLIIALIAVSAGIVFSL